MDNKNKSSPSWLEFNYFNYVDVSLLINGCGISQFPQ